MTKIQYSKEIIDFLEACYGENMLSPGGETINEMFKNKSSCFFTGRDLLQSVR